MTPTLTAITLERRARRRLDRLAVIVGQATSLPAGRIREHLISYATIETLSAWGSFSRAYYLSCFFGFRLTRGVHVAVSPPFGGANEAAALAWAVNRWRKKKLKTWSGRDEPPWHSTGTLLTLCADLQVSHLSDVRFALSPTSRVFADLPAFRHFFAHRNELTLREVAAIAPRLGIPPLLRPAEALIYRNATQPRGVLAQWLLDLREITTALCK